MNVLIWFAVYSLSELTHGESNPYQEALLARPWESEHGYVTVRPGAHMFYWLYYADGTRVCAESKPLIIWLQGGPGYAASGIGIFFEIGPFNINMEPRNHTWVKGRNVLLIDHPVGTGFSYVMDESLLAKTDQVIVTDLYETIKAFLKRYKGFRKTPTYIFGQNYGGKICPRLAYYLHTKIQKKNLEMNLKGIGIGSGWVDPKESILTTPKFLYNMGLVDQMKYFEGAAIAKELSNYVDKENYAAAELLLKVILVHLLKEGNKMIYYYNIDQAILPSVFKILEGRVNTYVKPMLADVVYQKLEWKWLSHNVSHSLKGNLMIPSTKFVELLLDGTDMKVAVYNGNLDAMTPIAGSSNWVHKLKWRGCEKFKYASRIPMQGTNNGFYKEAQQLSLWWIYGSGHWVPEDNPVAMEQILEYVMSDK